MFSFITGILLLSIPFLMAFCFIDKRQGFLTIFTGLFILHTSTALITQFFGVFTYSTILTLQLFYALVSILIFIFFSKKHECILWLKKICNAKKIIALFIFLLVFGYFVTLRYFYTGEVSTMLGVVSVTESEYFYPMYSDEWVGLAYTHSTITHQGLPLVNPLDETKNLKNILLIFFSLTSYILLILGIPPLISYGGLSLFVVGGILITIFYLLREYRVVRPVALIGILFVPLISNSSSITGIISYVPFTLSLLLFLISLLAHQVGCRRACIALSLCAFVLYPPFLIFIAPSLLCLFWKKKKYLYGTTLLGLLLTLGIALSLFYSGFSYENIFKHIENLLWQSQDYAFASSVLPWSMLPIPILTLALLGIYVSYKQRLYALFYSTLTGILFWIWNSFTLYFFVINPSRIISITSLLLILMAGLGLNNLYKYVRKRLLIDKIIFDGAFLLFGIFFCFFSFSFDSWKNIPLVKEENDKRVETEPKTPPINRYLIKDDLLLFKDIYHSYFLAPAWKGLVIAAGTHNYPLESKASTVTMSTYKYHKFMNLSCFEKEKISKKYSLKYVYSSKFDCPHFTFLGKSREGFHLYKFDLESKYK